MNSNIKACPNGCPHIKDTDIYCWRCGKALYEIEWPHCPICTYPIMEGMKFCTQCGQKVDYSKL